MRAAIQTGIRTIEVRELALPERPEGWALIRPLASGICGSDLHPYHGRATPQALPEGHEDRWRGAGLAARVCGTGEGGQSGGDRHDLPGDRLRHLRVLSRGAAQFHCPTRQTAPRTGGGFAELLTRRPEGLFPLPAGMTAEQGSLVEPLAVGVPRGALGAHWRRARTSRSSARVPSG
ncbi:MAG: alcohol dehydrogenase catalytic domain-containing protein [Baekduia sp.]